MRWLCLGLAAGLALLGGCTNTVVVEGSLPRPLVQQIPARVGIHYPQSFQRFSHQEDIEGAGAWDISLGRQNLAFFRRVLGALFQSVTELPAPQPTQAEAEGLDGVVIPSIEEYGFTTPEVTGLKFFEVSIKYRIALHAPGGDLLGAWSLVGYGKGEGGAFSADDAVADATRIAIRDGAAQLAVGLIDRQAIKDWLAGLDGPGASPGTGASP